MNSNWNKNKGIRVSIHDSNQLDISIVGFSKEKNNAYSPEVDKSTDSYFTMRYILNGSGYAIINDEKKELKRNTLLVSFPRSHIKLRQSQEDPYTMAWLSFHGQKAKYWLSQISITPESPLLYLPENKSLRSLFSKTPGLCFSHPDSSDLIALSSFYQIIKEIKFCLPSTSIQDTKKRAKEAHVLNAINYINQHYSDPELSSSVVAKFLFLNPRYFSSIFKLVTGTTFSRYLQEKRISVANSLMAQGETNISEIATKVGFSSLYYFSNTYKRLYNDSPTKHMDTIKKQ